MPLETNIQRFIEHLQFEKRYSPLTVQHYQIDLAQFSQFLIFSFGVEEWSSVTPTMVRSWLAALKEDQLKASSLHRKLSSIRTFFKYLLRIGLIAQLPVELVVAPKKEKRLPHFLSAEEANTLTYDPGKADDFNQLTAQLVVATFYLTGIRRQELINLTLKDIDWAHLSIKVKGKGGKERLIPVDRSWISAIEQYLKHRSDRLADVDSQRLFIQKSGKPLSSSWVYQTVRKMIGEVSTVKKRSPHVLRHTFATQLMNSGAEINAVKELLGHSGLAATQVYTHTNIQQLIEAFQQAHPKAK